MDSWDELDSTTEEIVTCRAWKRFLGLVVHDGFIAVVIDYRCDEWKKEFAATLEPLDRS
jgi:hypothetical protein